MPHIVKSIQVQDKNRIILPRVRPEPWISSELGFMAPLHCKRGLLIDEGERFHVWTICNKEVSTEDWDIPRTESPELYYEIKIESYKSAHRFIIPIEIIHETWLPETGGALIREIIAADKEINIWVPVIRNKQLWREKKR